MKGQLRGWRVAEPYKQSMLDEFHELMPVSGGEYPLDIFAFKDRAGYIRKFQIRYPGGWLVTIRLDTKRRVTSRKAEITLDGRPDEVTVQ